MFNGKKFSGIGLPLPPSMKFTQIRNEGESKKLNKSVEKYEKELERRIRDLSTHQNKLLSSRRREVRGGSLPANSLNTKKELRQVTGKLSGAVSCSALARRPGNPAKSVSDGGDAATKSDSTRSTKPLLPPLIIPCIQLPKEDSSPQSPESPKSPAPSSLSPRRQNALLKWKQLSKNVTRTQCLPPSQQITPGSPNPRFKRRGSETFESSLQSGFGSEPNSLLVQRHRRRRGSCPVISYSEEDLFQENTRTEELKRKKELEKQMGELKACRYLRLPCSIDEHGEDAEDTTDENSGI